MLMNLSIVRLIAMPGDGDQAACEQKGPLKRVLFLWLKTKREEGALLIIFTKASNIKYTPLVSS